MVGVQEAKSSAPTPRLLVARRRAMSVARDRVVDEYDSATVFGGKFGANFLSLVHRNDELIFNTNLPTESLETCKTLLAQAQESRRSLGAKFNTRRASLSYPDPLLQLMMES